jgi:hypothetical protein
MKAVGCKKCNCGQCHFAGESNTTPPFWVQIEKWHWPQLHFLHPAAFIEVGTVFGSLTKCHSKKWFYVDTIQFSIHKRALLIFYTTPTSKSHNRLAAVLLRSCVNCPEARSRGTLASRGNSVSKNLRQETQWPKCCLYKTPYVAAPVREIGDVIARTPLYMQLSTDAPTRTRIFFWFTSNAFLKRPVLVNWRLLRPFSMKKPHAKAVPRKDFFTHLRTLETRERDAEWLALTIARHIHGASVPLGMTVAQKYDVPRDWLWDLRHMAGIRLGSRCKGISSKEGPHYCFEQSMMNPTINLIHEFGNPLGIPYPSFTV